MKTLSDLVVVTAVNRVRAKGLVKEIGFDNALDNSTYLFRTIR